MAARLTAYIVALIVGVTFIAGLIVGAQRADDGPVDVMVVNGRVYTADGEGTIAEAVAIQGNKIVRVGSTREIQRLRRAQTIVIDARGGTVLPAFTQTDARLLSPTAESSAQPVSGPVPSRTRGEELIALQDAISEAHRRGITSVHTAATTAHELDLYDELRRENALALRVYGTIDVPATSTDADLEALDALRTNFPDDPLLKAGAASITFAASDVAPRALNRLVAELDRRGWQIIMAAADDAAVAMAREAYKHVVAVNPMPPQGRRHRIASAAIFGPVNFRPFEALGVVAPSSADAATPFEVIDAHTRNAAWASFDEHRKGSLERDMLADVVVLSKDILTEPVGRLSEAEISVTIFDGKVVFKKPTESDN